MASLKSLILFILVLFSFNSYAYSLTATSSKDMVVTSQYLASQVGSDILKQGGNAIDAAVAVGYALAVVEPCCGNIGGGGFMLIHLNNNQKNIFIDFRETAPLKSNANLFLDKSGKPLSDLITKGYLAVAVPGTVLGLNTALKEYGTLSLKTVIQPAINLAYQQKQQNLAHTLEKISNQNSDVFYHGDIAQKIVSASQQNGGILSLQDFENYKVKEREPIICDYKNYEIISAPPPSSGGITLCEMLKISEPYPTYNFTPHYTLEAMRYAYADRNSYLGDPDYVNNNAVKKLLSDNYIKSIQQKILPYQASDSRNIGFLKNTNKEKAETTHYSIVDQWGNAVAVTYTLNGFYGAKVIAGDTGFYLNNEMDDFTLKPGVPNQFKLIQSDANAIQPGKRPLSSMTPTIILKNNKLFMVLGAPGGSTIPTQVLETIQNIIDKKMSLQSSVDLPRYHMQWLPDSVYMEPNAFSFTTLQLLNLMGYRFQMGSPYNLKQWGAVAAILRDPQTGILYGAMDNRRPKGAAIGGS